MTAQDVYGNECMNYYQNHLPNTYADLLGAYTATWKYQDGTLVPGEKIRFVYTDYDFIPGLEDPAEDEEETAGDENAAEGDSNDDGATEDDNQDSQDAEGNGENETDEADGQDNAEGETEGTTEGEGAAEGDNDSSENNNNDDEDEQENGASDPVTEIGDGVDEC